MDFLQINFPNFQIVFRHSHIYINWNLCARDFHLIIYRKKATEEAVVSWLMRDVDMIIWWCYGVTCLCSGRLSYMSSWGCQSDWPMPLLFWTTVWRRRRPVLTTTGPVSMATCTLSTPWLMITRYNNYKSQSLEKGSHVVSVSAYTIGGGDVLLCSSNNFATSPLNLHVNLKHILYCIYPFI